MSYFFMNRWNEADVLTVTGSRFEMGTSLMEKPVLTILSLIYIPEVLSQG